VRPKSQDGFGKRTPWQQHSLERAKLDLLQKGDIIQQEIKERVRHNGKEFNQGEIYAKNLPTRVVNIHQNMGSHLTNVPGPKLMMVQSTYKTFERPAHIC
jgi:hypothetical protein